MYLFDTNIFLEIFLGQQNALRAQKVLGSLATDKRGTIASFSCHGAEAILSGANKNDALVSFVEFLQEHPYLDRYETSLLEEHAIAQLAPKLGLDYDDALQYYVAKQNNLTLVTFDSHFQKVRGIRVLFP